MKADAERLNGWENVFVSIKQVVKENGLIIRFRQVFFVDRKSFRLESNPKLTLKPESNLYTIHLIVQRYKT